MKNLSRSSRRMGNKSSFKGISHNYLGAGDIPFKLPKLQKHTCITHPLLGDSTFYPTIDAEIKLSLLVQVLPAVDSKRNETSSALLAGQ